VAIASVVFLQSFLARQSLIIYILIVTNTGYLGLGNPQPGDEVWVLLGGNSPFVLRPVPDSSQYRLVGDCYVQGIMDGEALADGDEKQRSVTLI
jgi:hypothetical protein